MIKLPKEKWKQGWNEQTWTEHVVTVWTCSGFCLLIGLAIAVLFHL